jgi:predicted NUDIX family phosphoesterase
VEAMSRDKEILVIKRGKLFADRQFQGFLPADDFDYYNLILDNYEWQARDKVERDNSYQQPIGYCLIVNPEIRKVFAFQRSSEDDKYSEKRLQGKWSWGIGGHIDKVDAETKLNEDPILTATMRELEEEVEIGGDFDHEVIGYINDDEDDVGQVHFAVVYLIKTNSKLVKPSDEEIMNYSFTSLNNLNKLVEDQDRTTERWSEIVLNPLNQVWQNQQ